jgi:hypothetical protein
VITCEHGAVTAARTTPPLISVRGVTAGLVVAVGAVHVMVGAQRSVLWSLEAAVLVGWGVLQVALGLGLVAGRSMWWWWAVSAVSTSGATAWLITRTAGYPFGPITGRPEVTVLELLMLVAQLVAAVLTGAVALTDGRLAGTAGWRFENLTPLLVAAAALPGIAASSWLEAYAFDPALGSVHVHSPTQSQTGPLTLDERRTLATELEAARSLALTLPTLADARDAGLVVSGDSAVGVGVQAFDPAPDPTAGFDLSVPRAWIYANDTDDAPVVGLLYDVVASHPPLGFAGGDDEWHLHPGECLVDDGSGDTLAVPLDPVITGADCDLVDGELTGRVHWMLRVWSAPGWDSPLGVFAHDHPGLPAT